MEITEIFDSIREATASNANEKFFDAAKKLFSNFYIKKGSDEYYFLEVEVYYHSKEHQDNNVDGKSFVYQRNCTKDGQFFLHASGVDICMSNEGDSYGGILLRSLLLRKSDGKEYVVTGPWDCYLSLFSYTSGDIYPRLETIIGDLGQKVDLRACKRRNAEGKTTCGNRPYAFYDNRYVSGNGFISELERYDYAKDASHATAYYPNFEKRKCTQND